MHAEHTAYTRKHEPDHTDQEYIIYPERSRSSRLIHIICPRGGEGCHTLNKLGVPAHRHCGRPNSPVPLLLLLLLRLLLLLVVARSESKVSWPLSRRQRCRGGSLLLPLLLLLLLLSLLPLFFLRLYAFSKRVLEKRISERKRGVSDYDSGRYCIFFSIPRGGVVLFLPLRGCCTFFFTIEGVLYLFLLRFYHRIYGSQPSLNVRTGGSQPKA